LETVGIMLMIGDIHSLAANISFAAEITFITFDLDDLVIFYTHFQPAILGTKDTAGMVNRSHIPSCCFS
jgi:hypothetical protein